MKNFLLFSLVSVPLFLSAQTTIPKRKIELLIGRSIHGTGDMRGLSWATEYVQQFRRHISWGVGIGGTIHDGFEPLLYNDPSGNSHDGSIRYTTAGVQVTGSLDYSFIRTKHHDLKFRLGTLLRYQSSSYPDELGILYPAATGYPVPLIEFRNITPQRTTALGGAGQFQYSYSFHKLTLGILTGFQTDTNGDTLIQFACAIGRQF